MCLLEVHNYFYQQNQKKSIKITFKNNKFARYITPTVPEQTPLKRLHQFHNRNQVITTWQNWNNWSTTEPPNYMPYHTINYHISLNPFTTSHYEPRRQWLLLKGLFWPKHWHYYYLPEFLEKFLNILIQQFEFFSVLALDRNRIYMLTYSVVKFYLLLGCPTP